MNAAADFALDPRLAADTQPVADLPLSRLLLMDDARYGWLVLVPRRAGLRELADLSRADQHRLLDEIEIARTALAALGPYDKLNLGALGNVVEQLHVHVIARHRDDAAWPGPVWGHSPRLAHAAGALAERLQRLRGALPP
ncbi:MAG TPA: HIT family protein [Dokdonella sp.]|uniref:HIT family protein n=1 Tax=Dokdonella sp. TaxID=2291710 RepID=UPI002D095CDB|nr:HIT family protein [Dokdonella sp.]HUD43607.1 HIT family protein [Dokdonella sp.]